LSRSLSDYNLGKPSFIKISSTVYNLHYKIVKPFKHQIVLNALALHLLWLYFNNMTIISEIKYLIYYEYINMSMYNFDDYRYLLLKFVSFFISILFWISNFNKIY